MKYTNDEGECQRDNELMAIKIVVELNKATPFKNRIRLLDIGDQRITLKGFSGYDMKGLLGTRGWGGMSKVDTKAFMLPTTRHSMSGHTLRATNSPARPAISDGYKRAQYTP